MKGKKKKRFFTVGLAHLMGGILKPAEAFEGRASVCPFLLGVLTGVASPFPSPSPVEGLGEDISAPRPCLLACFQGRVASEPV